MLGPTGNSLRVYFFAVFSTCVRSGVSGAPDVTDSAMQIISLDQCIYLTALAMAMVSKTEDMFGVSSCPDLILVTKSEPNTEVFPPVLFSLEGLSGHQSKGFLLLQRPCERPVHATQTAFRRHQSGCNQAVKLNRLQRSAIC